MTVVLTPGPQSRSLGLLRVDVRERYCRTGGDWSTEQGSNERETEDVPPPCPESESDPRMGPGIAQRPPPLKPRFDRKEADYPTLPGDSEFLSLPKRPTIRYRGGTMSRFSNVEVTRPPRMTTASGCSIS